MSAGEVALVVIAAVVVIGLVTRKSGFSKDGKAFHFWEISGVAYGSKKIHAGHGLYETEFFIKRPNGDEHVKVRENIAIADGQRVQVVYARHHAKKKGELVRFVNKSTRKYTDV